MLLTKYCCSFDYFDEYELMSWKWNTGAHYVTRLAIEQSEARSAAHVVLHRTPVFLWTDFDKRIRHFIPCWKSCFPSDWAWKCLRLQMEISSEVLCCYSVSQSQSKWLSDWTRHPHAHSHLVLHTGAFVASLVWKRWVMCLESPHHCINNSLSPLDMIIVALFKIYSRFPFSPQ